MASERKSACRAISRKKIAVTRSVNWTRGSEYKFSAEYPGFPGYCWGSTARDAREEMIRVLVQNGFVDPRPVEKGGVR